MAQYWEDPKLLHMGPLPKFANGEGSTVFWTTGCALFKHGQNKEKAAEYIKALTHNQQIWKDSIVGTKTAHPGQLPPYNSIYTDWSANKPDWMPPFVSLVRGQLDRARAIKNHVFGLQQFVIAKPIWESYLKGEEADPKVAIDPPATMNCALAAGLAKWLKTKVQPEAQSVLGTQVVKLRNATSYSCRNRYGGANTPLSEHALANLEMQWWHTNDIADPPTWQRMQVYPNPMLGSEKSARMLNSAGEEFFNQQQDDPPT